MLTNEYSSLLDYLESQKDDKSSAVKIKGKPEAVKKELPDNHKAASEKTKKLIEECQENIHSDIPLERVTPKGSKGFDVAKFEELMRAKLVDEHKRLQSYERPYISVTELYSCLRQKYYARMKYPIDVKEQYRFSYLHLINAVGNTVHDIVQSLYDFSEVEKTIVSEKYMVKGRIDALRERYLYEMKTIDAEKFKNKYSKEHYYQGLVYAYILNSEYNYQIEHITIVYIIRNLKRIIPFDLPFDSKIAESFLKNALTLRDHITRKSVAEPINATIEQCNFCQYRKFCEKDSCEIPQPFAKKDKHEKKDTNVVFMM